MTGYRCPPSLERWRLEGDRWVSERTGEARERAAMAAALASTGQSGAVAYEDTWALLPDAGEVPIRGRGSVYGAHDGGSISAEGGAGDSLLVLGAAAAQHRVWGDVEGD